MSGKTDKDGKGIAGEADANDLIPMQTISAPDVPESASIKSTDAVIDTHKEDLNDLTGASTDPDQHNLGEGEVEANGVSGESALGEIALSPEQLANPDLTSFFDACQKGNLAIVQQLISSKTVSATDTFSDQVTGLHWAAINDNLAIVKYLCENEYSQAEPNHKGGDLQATALHWACRNGLTYIVDYFLSHTSADPTLRDSQSYNALHLAVHSSNIMLVIYIVLKCCANVSDSTCKQIYIDEPDDNNRTSLHWAAYQGDIFTVNTLLRFGADVGKIDNTLFIPLHWAFMRGSKAVLKSLVEAKSDIFIKNDKGKDSFEIAKDMNCYGTWVAVLKECNILESNGWVYKAAPIDAKTAKIITFLFPYILLPSALAILSFSEGWAIPKLALTIVILGAGLWIVNSLVLPTYIRESKAIAKSPFLAGIFSATAFWCVITWLYNIVPVLWLKSFFTNVTLGLSIAVVGRTFFKTMFINPGYVPTPSDNTVIMHQIEDLIGVKQFDSNSFCIEAHVRKPLRSRYSRSSGKLVARFDHYCPWVYNEIGVRNHKLFMTFVYTLSFGIFLYIYLSLKFFDKFEGGPNSGYDSDDETQKCFLLSEDLCIGYKYHPFHFNMVIWTSFQALWVLILELTQTFQIVKGITTWEFSMLTEKPSHNNKHSHGNDGFKTCMKLIGLDQFFLTIKVFVQSFFTAVENHTATSYNPLDDFEVPSDYGWRKNWADFWFLGEYKWRNLFFLPIEGENNLNGQVVDYYKLYEYPAKASSEVV